MMRAVVVTRATYSVDKISSNTGEDIKISIRVTMEIRVHCTAGRQPVNNNQEVEAVIKEEVGVVTKHFRDRESV